MATKKQQISEWFDDGKGNGFAFMIIVCDTYDYEDYPVYTKTFDFPYSYAKYDGKNMQRIMEVYNLNLEKEAQLSERRSFHFPDGFRRDRDAT